MLRERPGADDEAIVPLIAPTALAARQWELALSDARRAAGATVWPTAVRPYRAFVVELWQARHPDRPSPLTREQSQALWRRIVAESPEAPELLGSTGPAEWAADAWQLLHRWRIEPRSLRARGGEHDFRALLEWCGRYEAELRAHGWLDDVTLEASLLEADLAVPAALTFVDDGEAVPLRTALRERLDAAGCALATRAVPVVQANVRRAGFADDNTELRAAAEWARERLAATPHGRIAVVVPRVDAREADVARCFDGAAVWTGGTTAVAAPALGAALAALELTTPRATFATFSRWLRSPFFAAAPAERAARAALEVELRRTLQARLGFVTAWRSAGLDEFVRARVPASAAALDAALIASERAGPLSATRWAAAWQRVLTTLGWQPGQDAYAATALLEWQTALDAFGRLAPIVGAIDAGGALDELERILAAQRHAAPLPIHGIHVLERIEDVGPGYDAVWAAGLSDLDWPPAARGNPLLPHALKAGAGMPWSSPREARERATRSFAALRSRAPEIVLSWPHRSREYDTAPSPALLPHEALPEATAARLAARAAAAPAAAVTWTTTADAVPALPGPGLPGGAGALRRQARAPLLALVDHRLAAKPLEPVAFGLPAWLQGKLVHAALERWLRPMNGTGPTVGERPAPHDSIRAAVRTAALACFGRTRHALAALFELECERLTALLEAFALRETQRRPFAVAAVEERGEAILGGLSLRVRLDRLDRLDSGGLAVIDYKTGKQSGRAAWWGERLHDVQVPLYAVHTGAPVAAAVIVRLHEGTASYEGYWPAGELPDKPRDLPDGRTWNEQLDVWRRQLETLAAELAGGDARLLLDARDEVDEARGAYACLTRLPEALAARRRGSPP